MAVRESILVIGRGSLAQDVVARLVADSAERRVTVVSTTPASPVSGARQVDPASPVAAREFGEIFLESRPTLILMLALSESPVTPAEPWLHDVALCDAVVSGLERFLDQVGGKAPTMLLLSSIAVYGVATGSPLVFDERSRLPGDEAFAGAHARWAAGLRAAERRLVSWAVGAGARVGVLRAASVLGGEMDSPVGALLRATVPVRVLGYDPPFQVLHYDDLVEAVTLAAAQPPAEVLNIVGRAVLPLSRLLALAGVFAPALPGPVADRLAPASMDGAHLRWRTLADGRRATQLLGFRPQRSVEDCLRARR